MKFLVFKIQINASNQKIWEVLFTQDAQRNWTSAMNDGNYFEGNWEEGTVMRFLDQDYNGMYNLVTKNKQGENLEMKHLGWIVNGEQSPQDWEDSTVSYFLESNDCGTLLTVKVNSLEEFVDFFNSKYPSNFEKIKKLSEK